MKTYFVMHKINARFVSEVQAENIDEAIREAEAKFIDADFGDAEDIDAEAFRVEDEAGNYVWEKPKEEHIC